MVEQSQLASIASDISDIKVAIAGLVEKSEHSQRNYTELWEKFDEVREAISEYQDGNVKAHSLMDQRITSEVSAVDRKVDGWIQFWKGAAMAFGVVSVVLQGIVLGALAWTYSNVAESATVNRLQQQQIDAISKEGAK